MGSWRGGAFLGATDADILTAAESEGRTLVTYDVRTIPPLLRRIAEMGGSHGGVILVSVKAFPPGDTRGLVRALTGLAGASDDLRSQVLYLSKSTT